MAPATLSRLAISKVVTFTSTYDHRIIQGAESGAFLARVEELLLGEHGFYEGVFADLGIPFRPFQWEVDRNPPLAADGHTDEIAKQARVLELINAYRVRGHLIADIDPLRSREIAHHPELDLETYGLTIWDLDREFWTGGLKGGDRMPLRQIIAVMRRVYCGKIGTEYRYISSPTEKYWIRERIAAATAGEPLPAEIRKRLLEKLDRGRGVRALPGHEVSRPAALLGRRLRHGDPAPRPARRGRRGARHRRGRDRHVPPRPAEHPRQRRRQLRRAHLQRLRGRRPPGLPGRRGRRQVPPGRARDAPIRDRPRRRDPGRVESVAPRGRRPGRRGRGPRQAGAPGRPRAGGLEARAAGAAPRRRGVRGPGHGRRGPEPRRSCRATGRAARSTSSSTTRSASRRRPPRAARPSTRRTSPRSTRSRSSTSTPTTPRPPTACSRSRSTTGRSSTRTSSST